MVQAQAVVVVELLMQILRPLFLRQTQLEILLAAMVVLVSSFSNTNKSIMQKQFGLSMDQAHGSVQMASMRSIT